MVGSHLEVSSRRVRDWFWVRMPKSKTVKTLLEKPFPFGLRVSQVETNAGECGPLSWELGHHFNYDNLCCEVSGVELANNLTFQPSALHVTLEQGQASTGYLKAPTGAWQPKSKYLVSH
jgi:hypothetical protein